MSRKGYFASLNLKCEEENVTNESVGLGPYFTVSLCSSHCRPGSVVWNAQFLRRYNLIAQEMRIRHFFLTT